MKFACNSLRDAGHYASSPGNVGDQGAKDASARCGSSNDEDATAATEVSERAKRRTTEWKRVLNPKMKRELLEPYGGRLLFPTFRDGQKHRNIYSILLWTIGFRTE